MAKFTEPFYAVPDGAIYPIQYQAGDECPKELEAAAQAQGALELPKPAKGKAKG